MNLIKYPNSVFRRYKRHLSFKVEQSGNAAVVAAQIEFSLTRRRATTTEQLYYMEMRSQSSAECGASRLPRSFPHH